MRFGNDVCTDPDALTSTSLAHLIACILKRKGHCLQDSRHALRGTAAQGPVLLRRLSLSCLVLLALLTVAQVAHSHQENSDADHCPLCIVMHTAAPVVAAVAPVALVQIARSAPVLEVRRVTRIGIRSSLPVRLPQVARHLSGFISLLFWTNAPLPERGIGVSPQARLDGADPTGRCLDCIDDAAAEYAAVPLSCNPAIIRRHTMPVICGTTRWHDFHLPSFCGTWRFGAKRQRRASARHRYRPQRRRHSRSHRSSDQCRSAGSTGLSPRTPRASSSSPMFPSIPIKSLYRPQASPH